MADFTVENSNKSLENDKEKVNSRLLETTFNLAIHVETFAVLEP